jgi:hypothetical protein
VFIALPFLAPAVGAGGFRSLLVDTGRREDVTDGGPGLRLAGTRDEEIENLAGSERVSDLDFAGLGPHSEPPGPA